MKRIFLALFILSLLTVTLADSTFQLPQIFSSNMVLQRDMFIPMWGKAEPGTDIKIEFAGSSTSVITKPNGHWKTYLPELPAGGPYEMTITLLDTTTKFTNVMVGDVWIGSGQSNMGMSVNGVNNAEQEIAAANYPNIRLFTVPRNVSGMPKWDVTGGEWLECSPETVPGFSAAAYFFGRKLHKELDVPIGLLHTSWGGTPIEAWSSAEMLKSVADYKNAAETLLIERPDYELLAEAQKPADALYSELIKSSNEGIKQGVHERKFKDDDWKVMQVPGWWENEALPHFDGFVWYRKTINLDKDLKGQELELNLGRISQHDITYFNGQEIGRSRVSRDYRTYIVPGTLVRKGENVIAVRMTNMWGNGGFAGAADSMYISLAGSTEPLLSLAGDWKYDESSEPKFPKRVNYQSRPAALYNAMLAPLIPYGIKGAIWYQGEANAGRAFQYRELFAKMIADWRVRWGQGYFPFLFVQLANFMDANPEPVESSWAELREAQYMALDYPNVGQAVIIDIGAADNIHPRNKQDVGKRLALAAQKIAYGQDIVFSGPAYKSMQIKENAVILNFDHSGSGLVAKGEKLIGFAIAGEDQKFVWADAKIKGDEIIVSSPDVTEPVAVRYAWANNPVCNLYNKEGLPASPFRTDAWKGITER